ncbi:MAG: glycosyltransferase family 2 protein [Candidatus Tantalella remota]|nr:glycosyltransferase family 2 protein [Candidatus Tantalella remota]
MIIFVLPVYNEEKNIRTLLESLSAHAAEKGWDYKVVISDDGSDDATVSIAAEMKDAIPLEIVSNPVNMGPGAAFDRGFRTAVEISGSEDAIVTMEADNTSDLAILDAMIAKLKNGPDVVLASCYTEEGGVEGTTFLRKVMSKGANFMIGLFSRDKSIKTFSSFYRCYRPEILSRAYKVYGEKFIEDKGFVCAVEILLKLQRIGARMEEVPMVLKCDKRQGKSKMKIVRTILSYFKLFVRVGFSGGHVE